ncbi:MAG: 6-bladed beta-propeller [Candidatus Aegiribacteria sp.]
MKYSAAGVLLMLLAAGCGGDGSGETAAGDVPTLPVDTLRVSLEIGDELGDSTETFGAIVDVMFDDEGNILVLDQVEAALKVYTPEGGYVRHAARRGSGPGELGMPWDMFAFPDGRLMVMDPMKQGFVVFDDSLEFVEEIQLWTQNPPFFGTAVSQDRFAAYKIDTDMAGNNIVTRRTVAVYSYGEEEWDRVLWQDSMVTSMNEVMENPSLLIRDLIDPLSIASDGSGGIFFSLKDGEDYTVTGWDISGEEILSISMDLSPVEKTPEEIAAESLYVSNYIGRMSGGGGFPFEFQPDPFKDMVTDLDTGPDGNLWVRRGTMNTPFFDIFDPASGELLHHAVFPAEGWSWKLEVSERGIMAWEEDPELGYQKLYVLE